MGLGSLTLFDLGKLLTSLNCILHIFKLGAVSILLQGFQEDY